MSYLTHLYHGFNLMSAKVKLILLTFLIFCVVVPSCPESASSGEKMCPNNEIIVNKDLSGQKIIIQPGVIIQIELPFIGGAGYNWHIDNLNAEYLELISEHTEKISEEGMVGAPVLGVWRFKAKKAGETEIKMDQYRPWEGIKKATDHFILRVIIK